MATKSATHTVTIDNFAASLTRRNLGDMNSGQVKYTTTFGVDPFSNPGQLKWFEQATQIDPTGAVITDLIVAGKERVENGISYVYTVGHTGRVYKIQVNNPSIYNPDYDNPVLLTTLTINSPTFTRGGAIEFFGATEVMYIGHDMGLTSLHFDGSNEAFIGVLGSWTQNVPRPMKQFVGNLYVGNGNNIAEFGGATLIINTYTKLSPGYPANTQVRDLDLSADGTYLEAVVTRLALPDITLTTQDTTTATSSDSYIFRWNGTDVAPTSVTLFPSFSLNANRTFGSNEYTFGYDLTGGVVYNPTERILTPILSQAPLPNAIGSNGNLIAWLVPEFSNGFLKASLFLYGQLDFEVPTAWYRQLQQAATGTETDVIRVPFMSVVSNLGIGSQSNGYSGGVFSTSKIYFSTLETSSAPTTKYKFYKFHTVSTGMGTSAGGVYETQNQDSIAESLTSRAGKKFQVTEIRVYTQPLVTNNSFQIDVIDQSLNPISDASQVFTVGTTATAGTDLVQYNPTMPPVHSLGIRITNLGTAGWVGDKIEIDVVEAGK